MHPMRCALLVAASLTLTGCASILESRNQEIVVNTEPPGATCRLLRSGTILGQINPTPGSLEVRKSTYDVVIVCDKNGYHETSYVDTADVAGATVVSAILGGATGWAIDSTTGKANIYESPVTIRLVPISGTQLNDY
jgi:hypothetical protein